ncbi:MAG: DNA repair protein RadA [Chloroflexi bacterium]|nr:DNA repair protein RadA [Chloroflexota bacterium]
MPKSTTQYVCQQCGRTSPVSFGRCPSCNAWGSMVEEIIEMPSSPSARKSHGFSARSKPVRLEEISGDAENRLKTPISEFSRVLGGGIVPGSIILVGGDPGIGKSTLLLQMAMEISSSAYGNHPVLYVSGEESERQIKMRAMRLQKMENGEAITETPKNLQLVTETNLDIILEHIQQVKPEVVVIDSIQTITLPEFSSSAGSVSQVRETAARLRELAKSSGIAVFVIGHVTKEGVIAGPRVLEHIVDTVLYLEGDRYQSYRLLRSVKNRFGATSEVGVFEMRDRGMVEVTNPSEAFLAERLVNTPGSAIVVTMEGTRPLLVEIQGLTTRTNFGNPRRTANGLDINRVMLNAAVLTRRAGINLTEQDVFVNVVGGLTVEEPAADLAMSVAIASSMRDIPVKADMVLIGEIGLSGELRWVSQMIPRLREAAKLGFKQAVIPRRTSHAESLPDGIKVLEARSLQEALRLSLINTDQVDTKGK